MNAKSYNHVHILWSAALLALTPMSGLGAIKEMKDVDLDALTYETQRTSQKSDELTLVWWVPDEFWAASFAQDPKAPVAQERETFLRSVQPYTMVIVVDGAVGPYGGVLYKSEEAVRAITRMVDAQGNSYAPLTETEMDPEVRSLIRLTRPFFVNLYGSFGQNVHVLLFPGRTGAGANLADATNIGRFRIVLDDREFRWQLPLDSLLLGKVCNACSAECKGSWNYCPWCGGQLAA